MGLWMSPYIDANNACMIFLGTHIYIILVHIFLEKPQKDVLKWIHPVSSLIWLCMIYSYMHACICSAIFVKNEQKYGMNLIPIFFERDDMVWLILSWLGSQLLRIWDNAGMKRIFSWQQTSALLTFCTRRRRTKALGASSFLISYSIQQAFISEML